MSSGIYHIQIDGIVYESIKEASRQLGVVHNTITNRIKKGIYNYV